jgi:tRNA-splicing ligase RtcB
MITKKDLRKINDYLWEIPKSYRSDMRVPARVYVSEKMLEQVFKDESLTQLVNTTTLPGLVKYALAMPDMHEGYGFCIGGVAASKMPEGVISPGGVGFDINCGIRVLTSGLSLEEVKPHLVNLASQIQRDVPSGVGRGGRFKLDRKSMDRVLEKGVRAIIEKGFGQEEDQERCEARGCLEEARAEAVSDRAKKRGSDQLGTLGSGNHFLEIQKVAEIYDQEIAKKFGLEENQITVMIHSGSRGLGHQVCTDYVRIMNSKISSWGIKLPDRELACAPLNSKEGKDYFAAMAASANFAWANRQMIMDLVRKAWQRILGEDKDLNLIYDVAHNIAKKETHLIDKKEMLLVVHRKGATRAFPPGHPELPNIYQETGQPVLIPGSMGTASYILVGTEQGMEEAFGSVCHGSGRRLSRKKAKKEVWGADLKKELEERGIIVRCASTAGLAEEAPQAYKNIDEVVEVVSQAGLARKVARLVPLAVVKGE